LQHRPLGGWWTEPKDYAPPGDEGEIKRESAGQERERERAERESRERFEQELKRSSRIFCVYLPETKRLDWQLLYSSWISLSWHSLSVSVSLSGKSESVFLGLNPWQSSGFGSGRHGIRHCSWNSWNALYITSTFHWAIALYTHLKHNFNYNTPRRECVCVSGAGVSVCVCTYAAAAIEKHTNPGK